MKEIISLCARRPVSVIMFVIALFMGAVYSIGFLPLDKLPEIVYPRVAVETAYPGMGAAEVRGAVTIPLEDSLSAVKGLEEIKSVSRESASLLLLGFRWGTLPARAASMVREAIDTVYPGLPEGISKPAVISGDPSEEAHAIVAVRSLSGDNGFARNLAEYEIRSKLRKIDGAGKVVVTGGETREIRLRADPALLAARSVNTGGLAEMIAGETGDFPAGGARDGNRELTIVSSGKPESAEELVSLVISAGGSVLRVSDVARVNTEAAPRESAFIFRGGEQTALEIYRRPGADPVRLSRDIKKVVEDCSVFSGDVEVSVVFDSSPSIVSGIKNLGISGGLAALAVIFILAFFMGGISYSILAALPLPFSASAAFIVLAITGRSINAMSLGGLALGIGLVSDTSVIVLDLFCRNFTSSNDVLSPGEAGRLAASVSISSFTGALTNMIVFIPVIFLPGPLGALFGDLAVTLIVSVAAGWLYAQFCLPSLFCFFAARSLVGPGARRLGLSGFAGGRLENLYAVLLRKVLRQPLGMVFISALIAAAGLALLCFRPVEFISPEAVSEIDVSMDFPPGTSIEEAVSRGIALSEILAETPGLSFHYGRIGAEADDPGRRSNPDYRREKLIFRCFPEKGEKPEKILEKIKTVLRDFDSRELAYPDTFGRPSLGAYFPPDRTAGILGLSSAMTLAVKGSGQAECLAGAEDFGERLEREAGSSFGTISFRPSGTRPQLRLIPRRELCAMMGVSVSEIASEVYAASEGVIAGTIESDGRSINIRVSGELSENAPGILKSLPLKNSGQNKPGASPVFLGSLADIEWNEAETALARQDRTDVVYLDIFPAAGKNKIVTAAVNKLADPAENMFVSRADESVFVRYRASLVATVILVLLLLYLVLGAQFESFILPLILMLAIPFSMAGAGPALFISGSSIDSCSVLGLVALFGIAVNNGIVFFEISAEKISSGQQPVWAVYSGALKRFRPVLLTTLTTIFALLPLVVTPLGNSQKSMAATMLGGILVSGFLAFFAFPPVFILFLNSRNKRGVYG